jgi:serine-type D-Ala-D-Ala carboxypeptidase/endopeptidase
MPPTLLLTAALALLRFAPDAGGGPEAEASALDLVTQKADALLTGTLPREGGGVLRVARPSRVLFEKAYGGYRLDDAVPISSGTLLLSTVVLLQLVDAQKLTLETRVSSVLRDWPPDKAAITLRMLLAHTSGLAPTARCLDERNTTLEACVREISQAALRRDPGTAVIYGSTGYQVAGRMAEVVTGRSWAELFREHLTRPLGLPATGFGRTANPRIAGGAQTTAGEYGSVLDLILAGGVRDGVRLLSVAAVDAMFQDQSNGAPLVQSPYALFPGREASRPGLGLWLDRVDGQGHGLEALCQGAFGFTAWMDRERRLGGVLLVKGDLRHLVPVEQELRALFRQAVGESKR